MSSDVGGCRVMSVLSNCWVVVGSTLGLLGDIKMMLSQGGGR